MHSKRQPAKGHVRNKANGGQDDISPYFSKEEVGLQGYYLEM